MSSHEIRICCPGREIPILARSASDESTSGMEDDIYRMPTLGSEDELTADFLDAIAQGEDLRFDDGLPGLDEGLARGLRKSFSCLTQIQRLAIAPILAGRDVIGTAETGSGKTLAFLLPVAQMIVQGLADRTLKAGNVQCVVLSPTREISMQTDQALTMLAKYTCIRSTIVCGGVKQSIQEEKIRQGLEIVCACPGRLLDILRKGLHSQFRLLKWLVFDEADRMLDMGFSPDVTDLLDYLPSRDQRQTMLFSATLSQEVLVVAAHHLRPSPVQVCLLGHGECAEEFSYFCPEKLKADFLLKLPDLLAASRDHQVLIFVRTKARANRLCHILHSAKGGSIKADRVHGNRSQAARVRAISEFKSKQIQVLVATDLAARGIDLNIDLVINFDVPASPHEYLHRSGRARRCTTIVGSDDEQELTLLHDIEEALARNLIVRPPLINFDYHAPQPEHLITKSGHCQEWPQVAEPPPPASPARKATAYERSRLLTHQRQTSLPANLRRAAVQRSPAAPERWLPSPGPAKPCQFGLRKPAPAMMSIFSSTCSGDVTEPVSSWAPLSASGCSTTASRVQSEIGGGRLHSKVGIIRQPPLSCTGVYEEERKAVSRASYYNPVIQGYFSRD